MIWYIDTVNGSNTNGGHKIEEPLKDFTNIYTNHIKAGDKILIKRGSEINIDHDHTYYYANNNDEKYQEPVYIGAYGEGENPKFSRYKKILSSEFSLDSGNIYVANLENATGNPISDYNVGFLYDEKTDKIYPNKKDNLSLLTENFDFYCDTTNKLLYVYVDNEDLIPSELILPINQACFVCDSNVILENLTFTLTGGNGCVTSVAQGYYYITVNNCKFDKIGGSYLTGSTRYGNGFESYLKGKNLTVENCTFNQIYDTGVTIQGQTGEFENINFTHNLFNKCNWPCEQFFGASYGFKNARFTNNLCLLNGYGFGQGTRKNGSCFHLTGDFENLDHTEFEISNNVFYKFKNNVYQLPSDISNTDIKINNNIIYGYKNQQIQNNVDIDFKDYEEYINTYNHDYASKFIVLDEEYKGSELEETMLIANFYMNGLNKVFENGNSVDTSNSIITVEDITSATNVDVYYKNAVVINNMLLFNFQVHTSADIPAWTHIIDINIKGYKVRYEQWFDCDNSTVKFYTDNTSTSNSISLGSASAITNNSYVSFKGIISIIPV